jgi:hypothetical protein
MLEPIRDDLSIGKPPSMQAKLPREANVGEELNRASAALHPVPATTWLHFPSKVAYE